MNVCMSLCVSVDLYDSLFVFHVSLGVIIRRLGIEHTALWSNFIRVVAAVTSEVACVVVWEALPGRTLTEPTTAGSRGLRDRGFAAYEFRVVHGKADLGGDGELVFGVDDDLEGNDGDQSVTTIGKFHISRYVSKSTHVCHRPMRQGNGGGGGGGGGAEAPL